MLALIYLTNRRKTKSLISQDTNGPAKTLPIGIESVNTSYNLEMVCSNFDTTKIAAIKQNPNGNFHGIMCPCQGTIC